MIYIKVGCSLRKVVDKLKAAGRCTCSKLVDLLKAMEFLPNLLSRFLVKEIMLATKGLTHTRRACALRDIRKILVEDVACLQLS